jgi:ATP-dependent HslUV protease ATP-binding subunit HslU
MKSDKERTATAAERFEDLTPREIVRRLDEYIVGQEAAKRAVAVAIRNRLRRLRVDDALRDEIIPKNLILIGPTGVGKTEIARRMAVLLRAPFIKVEATKFTEVGYVGRDVDSIIRELMETAVRMVRQERLDNLQDTLVGRVVDRLVDSLQPLPSKPGSRRSGKAPASETAEEREARQARERALRQQEDEQFEQVQRIRARLRERIRKGDADDELVTIEAQQSGNRMMQVFTSQGLEEMGMDLQNMLEGINERPKKKKRVTVGEARRLLLQEEADKAVDMDAVVREAVERVELAGIVFLDEIDKIAHREGQGGHGGPDVSREGVQRDILPLVEGTSVVTKYGSVRTQHILFVAAGAFHVSKVSDLIPELQGRFPLRVELEALSEADFCRILREPKNSLLRQYTALLATEGVELEFTDGAIDAMARIATAANQATQNIGARRLHTVIEKLLEDISFDAPYSQTPAGLDAAVPANGAAADALDVESIRVRDDGHSGSGSADDAAVGDPTNAAVSASSAAAGPLEVESIRVHDDLHSGSGSADDAAIGGGFNGHAPPQPGSAAIPLPAPASRPQRKPVERIVIDAAFVENKLGELVKEKDVAGYIL